MQTKRKEGWGHVFVSDMGRFRCFIIRVQIDDCRFIHLYIREKKIGSLYDNYTTRIFHRIRTVYEEIRKLYEDYTNRIRTVYGPYMKKYEDYTDRIRQIP